MGNVYYPFYLTLCQVPELDNEYALSHIFYILLRAKVLK